MPTIQNQADICCHALGKMLEMDSSKQEERNPNQERGPVTAETVPSPKASMAKKEAHDTKFHRITMSIDRVYNYKQLSDIFGCPLISRPKTWSCHVHPGNEMPDEVDKHLKEIGSPD